MCSASAGLDVDPAAIRGQIGKGGDNLVPTLLPDLDEARQTKLAERHGAVFKARYIEQAQPFPGARDLVLRVHRGAAKIVLASSASQEELEHYIELLGIKAEVDDTVSIDDVGTSKPAPDIFATALGKLDGIAAGEAFAVGDTPYDIEAAGKSGIATIAVLSGGFDREALNGAVACYDDVAALLRDYDASPLAR